MMNELDKKRAGTSFKGYLYARYDQIVAAFGIPQQPHHSDNKIDVEWIISTPYGVTTIYNYKDGKTYLGESGLRPEEMCEWHIGGKKNESYEWIKSRLQRQIVIGF
jgi:hypothetical protein